MPVFVVTAEQAVARDRAAIEAGIESKLLMRRAGHRAAQCISARFPRCHDDGVLIFTGPGNNGGDGWVVAAECAGLGIPAKVLAVSEPRTPDAVWARSLVRDASPDVATPAVVVDALLGTGASGAPRNEIADAIHEIATLRGRGASVVALDLPSGLDATTGNAPVSVVADLTVSFGTIKRGQVMRRDICGELVVADIGLESYAAIADGAAVLIDADWVRERLPGIGARAHKGTRRRLLFVGASPGMAGATILASRAALRSGAGMVRCCAHRDSMVALQSAVPEATVVPWPAHDSGPDAELLEWSHALLIGPGLGLPDARRHVETWLRAWPGPTVLDADALTAFGGDLDSLGMLLESRPAVLTPHAGEAARLLGRSIEDVVARPFETAGELSERSRAVVLLKGVPTIVAAPGTVSLISARGTPALATAGSGDVLAGIVTTLLAQCGSAADAAAMGAFVHGRAAELANAGRPVRGVVLADVLAELSEAWRLENDALAEGELAWLPRVGDE
jgi:NAD(P)H-hydrate epimerase